MSHLSISKKNEVYLQVDSDPHVFYELSDQFTFELPGAKFMPQYRNKYWDGKIRLFNVKNGEIYVGLLDKIQKFCEDHVTTPCVSESISCLHRPTSIARTTRYTLRLALAARVG